MTILFHAYAQAGFDHRNNAAVCQKTPTACIRFVTTVLQPAGYPAALVAP
jgi:hypothetical protein